MKKEQTNTEVEFTENLYKTMSSTITEKIAQTKKNIEGFTDKIKARKEHLIELRAQIAKKQRKIDEIYSQISDIKNLIVNEKLLLSGDKKTKYSLKRELNVGKSNSKKLNSLYIGGKKSIDVSRFCHTKEQTNTEVEFTKDIYISMLNAITEKIAQTKQDMDDTIATIQGRKEYLIELRTEIAKRQEKIDEIYSQIGDIKNLIVNEKLLLGNDKKSKNSLKRELNKSKSNSKKLNSLYANGATTVDVSRFIPSDKQKTR